MPVQITLTLPDRLIDRAKRLGEQTQRDMETILADTIEMVLPTLENASDRIADMSALSDAEVLKLAESKMDEVQNKRLGELQQHGKQTGLTEAERYELLALLQIYQIGQLRKSEALAEAVTRGLIPPLAS